MFLFRFQVEGSAKPAGEGGREHQELSSESFIGGWKSTDGRWTWNRTVLYTPHRCLLNSIPILHSSQCSWSAIQLLVSYLSSEWCPWQDLILFCFDLEFLFTVICSYLFFSSHDAKLLFFCFSFFFKSLFCRNRPQDWVFPLQSWQPKMLLPKLSRSASLLWAPLKHLCWTWTRE